MNHEIEKLERMIGVLPTVTWESLLGQGFTAEYGKFELSVGLLDYESKPERYRWKLTRSIVGVVDSGNGDSLEQCKETVLARLSQELEWESETMWDVKLWDIRYEKTI